MGKAAMPLLNIQMNLREVGRIRTGDRTKAGKGTAPRKLDRFRFTTDDGQMLQLVADAYGGAVQPWTDAPTGEQWELYVSAERIPVMIVPHLRPITQWMEAWTGGGCIRRCDGQREQTKGVPCICLEEGELICKPTTRLQLVLHEIPGLGTWRLESHGYYAAVELGGTLELITKLAIATGEPVYGTLRLTQRTQKVTGQPVRHFAVPTLDVDVTVPELAAQVAAAAPGAIDGANAARLQALAAAAPVAPSRAFPDEAEREAAEQRGQAKLGRKRTPDMGPGRRREVAVDPLLETASEDYQPPSVEVREAFDSPLSAQQLKALQTLMRMTGLDDRDERLLFSARIIGRSISTSKDLTSAEASQIIDVLAAVEQGTAQYVTDSYGRIVGAVPVDTNLADSLHSDPVPHPDDLEPE